MKTSEENASERLLTVQQAMEYKVSTIVQAEWWFVPVVPATLERE